MVTDKRLRTIKRASAETGSSVSFFKELLRKGRLTRYKINSCTYVSLLEFESLASPIQHVKTETT